MYLPLLYNHYDQIPEFDTYYLWTECPSMHVAEMFTVLCKRLQDDVKLTNFQRVPSIFNINTFEHIRYPRVLLKFINILNVVICLTLLWVLMILTFFTINSDAILVMSGNTYNFTGQCLASWTNCSSKQHRKHQSIALLFVYCKYRPPSWWIIREEVLSWFYPLIVSLTEIYNTENR